MAKMMGDKFSVEDIVEMLTFRGAEQRQLHHAAKSVRDSAFGKRAVVRGVIEVTSACVKSCHYCPMRRENTLSRYILSGNQILSAVQEIEALKLTVVFLQAGEVGKTTTLVGNILPTIRRCMGSQSEILLNLGDKTQQEYAYLRRQGADSYIIKQESANPTLHYRMRHVELSERIRCIKDLVNLGFRVGVGTIVGLPGQTLADLAEDALFAGRHGAVMTSASPFVPAPGTPLENEPFGNIDVTLNLIAVMRLLYPQALIPSVSAIENLCTGGQARGFNAGANVITINFTPDHEPEEFPIYGKNRFVVKREHALLTLESAGLFPILSTDSASVQGIK